MTRALLFMAAAIALATPAAAQDFNNQSIVELTRAGLSEDVILSKIEGLPCSYDVSTDAIIALNAAEVSNRVIAAMVDRCVGAAKAQGASGTASDPMQKRSPGVYIEMGDEDSHDINQIRPTVASSGKVTGNGSILFPFKAKLGLSGQNANTQANQSSPVFYFYFETSDARVSDFGVSDSIAAQSPSEFSLVRFKDKKGRRELTVGKSNMFSTNLGIDPDDTIPFTIDEIGDGIFRVEPNSPLKPGQYGFVLRFGGEKYRIFDFSV